jgi:phosphatidylserine/phosphatidylglycerophosphate/cardiolipin synthase-like enzyme
VSSDASQPTVGLRLGGSRQAALVPLALALGETLGGWPQAATAVLRLPAAGLVGVGAVTSDVGLLLADHARSVGLVDASSAVDPVVAAELLVAIDVLAAADVPTHHPPQLEPPGLVFTVPAPVAGLVESHHRLDVVMLQTITSATEHLVVGGPYFNDRSVQVLSSRLVAAVEARGVDVIAYGHKQTRADSAEVPIGPDYDAPLKSLVDDLLDAVRTSGRGSVRLLWFSGPASSLMHAKFIIADRSSGYLGSANLTSQGMGEHLEVGVRLEPSQASQLVSLLDALQAAGMFTQDPATP